jgi:broad specificity phosphatase PhoE
MDHATIPLTPKGVEQARLAAMSFTHAPDLIIASPFSRAQLTAMATVAAFPGIPIETWPIQEFTYLEPARCANTTVDQRRAWVDAYWSRSDPTYMDGAGAESFRDFIRRAQSFLDRLAEHPAQDVAVFSHGQVINAVAWLIERRPQLIDGRDMADWREYEITNHVPNGCGYTLTKYPEDAGWNVRLGEPRIDVAQCVPGRAYQAVRDPERLLIEERAEALSAAGYPLPEDDPAMYAEQRLKEARAAACSSQAGNVIENTAAELSAREVSQVLREAIFGRSVISKVGHESWSEIYAGLFQITVDGWEISIYNDCDQLDYCEQGVSPEGGRWSFLTLGIDLAQIQLRCLALGNI